MKTKKKKRKFLFLSKKQDFLFQKNGIAKNAKGLGDLQRLIKEGYCSPFRWIEGSRRSHHWSAYDTSNNVERFCKILSIPILLTNIASKGGQDGNRIIKVDQLPFLKQQFQKLYLLHSVQTRKVLIEKVEYV